jgi:membrane protein implicated in regulation of membrane protease activity
MEKAFASILDKIENLANRGYMKSFIIVMFSACFVFFMIIIFTVKWSNLPTDWQIIYWVLLALFGSAFWHIRITQYLKRKNEKKSMKSTINDLCKEEWAIVSKFKKNVVLVKLDTFDVFVRGLIFKKVISQYHGDDGKERMFELTLLFKNCYNSPK